jgi:uncharacterized protein (TIGR03084 family)
VSDLVLDYLAECAALDRLLSRLVPDDWTTATPAIGWDVRDSVTHLAESNKLARECVTTGQSTLIDDILASGSIDEFEKQHLAHGRSLPGPDVRTWWLSTNAALADALQGTAADTRVPWGPNVMSLPSFTTARLMETWAHGLDCFDALAVMPEDTDRLRHVARLALRALPYAMTVKRAAPPGPVRLELLAPDGVTVWRLGDDDAPSVVSGSAGDWCRAAVNRDRRGERTRLRGEGPDAAAVIDNVQAYLAA